ncbi:hypothetical protein FACS189460_3950 [Deltaproteobacteria bacterium]|nr:hypothetical protein FACS189460_3950 [Deltaproteobacteria bacterium]
MTGPTLDLTAAAKINLCLKVLGRRPDGYHELDSVMARLTLADRLRLDFGDPGPGEDRLTAATDLPAGLPPDFQGPANLALRAVRAFREKVGWPDRPVVVHLEKSIPWGAGLGGGSADGAAVLAGLNQAAPRPLEGRELALLALSLGADLPFCLAGTALARARGRGEKLSPPPPAFELFRGQRLVLVKPAFNLATALVFKNLGLTNPPPENNLGPLPVLSPPGENDLLTPALRLAPALAEVAEAVKACRPLAWGLSGSGPTFWLQPAEARGLPGALQARPDWWVRETAVEA